MQYKKTVTMLDFVFNASHHARRKSLNVVIGQNLHTSVICVSSTIVE
jgi:hypothetical protein